jgi:hypothetical protein
LKFRLISAAILSLVIGGLYLVFDGGQTGYASPSARSGSVQPSSAPSPSNADEKALKELKIN